MKKKPLLVVITIAIIAIIAILINMMTDIVNNHSKENTSQEAMQDENITELTVVYAYQNAQWNSAIETMIGQFETENPDIRINAQTQYEDTVYEDRLSKLIARDELGDIVQLKNPELYASSGTLAAMPQSVSDLVQEEYRYTYDGQIYGVEAVGSTTGIVYNKEIFAKYGISEPTTYEEFLQACALLRKNQVTPIGVGGSDLWHMEYWTNHFMRTDVLSKNEDWLSDRAQGTVSWTDAEPRAMFEHMVNLFKSGYINKDWISTPDGSLAYRMSEGNLAMVYTGPWLMYEVEQLNSDMELGWFYLPDEEGNVYVGENRDVYWALTKECGEDAKKNEAATRFLQYFYATDSYTQTCESITGFPSTLEDIVLELPGQREKIVADYEKNERHFSSYIGDSDSPQGFEKKLLEILMDTLQGKTDVDGALAQLEEWQPDTTEDEEVSK